MAVDTVTICGNPMPKPRMTRADKWKKRPCVVRYRAWADKARLAVKEQIGKLPDPKKISHIAISAYFQPPKSCKSRSGAHRQRPDIDNIIKAIFDSLYEDDSAIPSLTATKEWGPQAKTIVTFFSED